jgi:hypothetical protein
MFERWLHYSGGHAFAPAFILLDYATAIRSSSQQQSYCRPSTSRRNQPGFPSYFQRSTRYNESTIFFRCNCLLHFSFHVMQASRPNQVAHQPLPTVPSGPSPQQLLCDLEQQLFKLQQQHSGCSKDLLLRLEYARRKNFAEGSSESNSVPGLLSWKKSKGPVVFICLLCMYFNIALKGDAVKFYDLCNFIPLFILICISSL